MGYIINFVHLYFKKLMLQYNYILFIILRIIVQFVNNIYFNWLRKWWRFKIVAKQIYSKAKEGHGSRK